MKNYHVFFALAIGLPSIFGGIFIGASVYEANVVNREYNDHVGRYYDYARSAPDCVTFVAMLRAIPHGAQELGIKPDMYNSMYSWNHWENDKAGPKLYYIDNLIRRADSTCNIRESEHPALTDTTNQRLENLKGLVPYSNHLQEYYEYNYYPVTAFIMFHSPWLVLVGTATVGCLITAIALYDEERYWH